MCGRGRGDGGIWVGEDAPQHLKSRANRKGAGDPVARRPLCVGLLQKPNYTPSFMGDLDPARPGGARASCTIARRRASGQPRLGELEGASRGRRGKPRKAKARNPGRPSEKSENVLGARGNRRALSRAHISCVTHSYTRTHTHSTQVAHARGPCKYRVASLSSRAEPRAEPPSYSPRPPTPRLSRALPPGHRCPGNDWGSWEGPQEWGSGRILPAER